MIRIAITGVLRFWREALAAVAPFMLLLPVLAITSQWISIAVGWFSSGVMTWLVQVFGIAFVRLFFELPTFGVSVIAGVAFGITGKKRGLRLAWIFGIGMFLAQTTVALLTSPSEWYLCLLNLGHVALPVAATWTLLRVLRPTQPGHCHKCGYDLTGNVSGVCPECGAELKQATPPSVTRP